MRIIFAGTPVNAAETLEALLSVGHTIVGVLTRKDARSGRGGTFTESAVANVASSRGLPCFKTNTIDHAARDWISSLEPDVGVIVAFGSILKIETLQIPQHGWLNLHYSLLPAYPGASPVQHAILDGLKVTGVTVFQLDAGIDSGPILFSLACPIADNDSTGSLLGKLTKLGSDALVATLDDLSNLLENKQQQLIEPGRKITKKISREMAKLDFTEPAQSLVNRVRAMNPEPVAWFELESHPVRVLEASILQEVELPKGVAQLHGAELIVGCLDTAVVLHSVQPAGKKPMSGADWFRGLHRDSLMIT